MISNKILTDDKSIIIKKSGKCSFIVIWDRADYLKKLTTSKQYLSAQVVYKEVEIKEKMFAELVETNNKFFKNIKAKGCISQKSIESIFPTSLSKTSR